MTMKLVDTEQLEADLTSVANRIRAKTGGEEKLAFPSGFESAVDSIESGADEILDEIEYKLSNGYTDYSWYFYHHGHLTEIPFEIFRHIENGKFFDYIFAECFSLTELPSFNLVNATQCDHFAQYCSKLKKVGAFNVPNATMLIRAFDGCGELETIGEIDISSCEQAQYMFSDCWALKEVRFKGSIISSLDFAESDSYEITHETLMSAINALYDWVETGDTPYGSTPKLILGSRNLAKLTDAEKAIPLAKGWVLE